MEELSLHILDIVENSVAAKSTLIKIEIYLNKNQNILYIKVRDNGIGIDKEILQQIESPFYTTKKERKIKVGLGIPLFKFSALQSNGDFRIDSVKGEFTEIFASFELDNIDRPPLGDIYSTLLSIILGHQDIDFEILIVNDGKQFIFNTKEIKEVIGDIPYTYPDVFDFISKTIKQGLVEIGLDTRKIY